MYQPFGQLPDGQTGKHRIAQMVAGPSDIAGLDIEKNENEFFRPNREMPLGRRAKNEFAQAHIAEEGVGRMVSEETETLGDMAVGSADLLERGIDRVGVRRIAHRAHCISPASASAHSRRCATLA